MQKPRKTEFDIAKGTGILLVIIGHMTEIIPLVIKDWIFTFHMPLFFVISGYFCKFEGEQLRKFANKRIKGLLIPYYIYGLLFWIFDKRLLNKPVKIQGLLDILLIKESVGVLWFLPVLFLSLLLTYGVLKLRHSEIMPLCMVAVGFILAKAGFNLIRLQTALYCSGFVYLGYKAKKLFDGEIKGKKYLVLINIASTCSLLLLLRGEAMPLDLSYDVELDIILNYTAAITSAAIVLELSRIVNRKMKLITLLLSHIGRNSIVYYPLMSSVPSIF